jgi:hypothetical protein
VSKQIFSENGRVFCGFIQVLMPKYEMMLCNSCFKLDLASSPSTTSGTISFVSSLLTLTTVNKNKKVIAAVIITIITLLLKTIAINQLHETMFFLRS